MEPQHWEFPARTGDEGAVRRWFGGWVTHPASAGVGAELYRLVLGAGGETILLAVTCPMPGRPRLSVYGRRPLPPEVRRDPAWARLLVLADAVGVTADGAGAWAELVV